MKLFSSLFRRPQSDTDHFGHGVGYLRQSDFNAGRDAFREASKRLDDLPGDNIRSLMLAGLALSSWASGNLTSAKAAFATASKLAPPGGDVKKLVAACSKHLAIHESGSGDFGQIPLPPPGFNGEVLHFKDLVPLDVWVFTKQFIEISILHVANAEW